MAYRCDLRLTWVKKDSEHGRWVAVLPNERPNVIIMKYGDKDLVYDRKNGKGVPVGASGEKELRCLRTKEESGRPIPEDDFDTAPFVLMRWRRGLFDTDNQGCGHESRNDKAAATATAAAAATDRLQRQ